MSNVLLRLLYVIFSTFTFVKSSVLTGSASTQPPSQLSSELLHELLFVEPNFHLEELANATDAPGEITRTFLSKGHRQAASMLLRWMAEAGMDTWVDAVGNVHGRVKCQTPNIPAQLIGSHYDTVVDGGKYDGALGIVAGIAAVKTLLLRAAISRGYLSSAQIAEAGPNVDIRSLLTRSHRMSLLTRPVEVIAFSDEEGVRFTSTFLGSSALAGKLLDSGMLAQRDSHGLSLLDALAEAGFDASPDSVRRLAMRPELVYGYVEVHIEQGPVLQSLGHSLGVVSAIAGQARLVTTVEGEQGHAGTVPMHGRRDSLAAAAQIIHRLESMCATSYPSEGSLVCTVGAMSIYPNASNVIPRHTTFTMDIRSRSDRVREDVVDNMKRYIQEVCQKRDVICDVELKHQVSAQEMKKDIVASLEEAIRDSVAFPQLLHSDHTQCPDSRTEACHETEQGEIPKIVSGAGHDAMLMAQVFSTGMIFVRCKDGVSHSPREEASPQDVAASVAALLVFLQKQTGVKS